MSFADMEITRQRLRSGMCCNCGKKPAFRANTSRGFFSDILCMVCMREEHNSKKAPPKEKSK